MANYIIKNNLPDSDFKDYLDVLYRNKNNEQSSREVFLSIVKMLSAEYPTKVTFRNKPLRGTIQVEIDGFYYYVELYKE